MHAVEEHTLLELQLLSKNYQEMTILQFFDRTETQGGRDYLRKLLQKPAGTPAKISDSQALLKSITANPAFWKIDVHRSYIHAVESYHALNVAHSMSQDVIAFSGLSLHFHSPH